MLLPIENQPGARSLRQREVARIAVSQHDTILGPFPEYGVKDSITRGELIDLLMNEDVAKLCRLKNLQWERLTDTARRRSKTRTYRVLVACSVLLGLAVGTWLGVSRNAFKRFVSQEMLAHCRNH